MEEVTLLFRHLPAELSVEERKDLLYFLGASYVKVMSKAGPMKNTAFAVFGSKDKATQVLNQFHQIEFLGSRLVVEFAKTQIPVSDVSGKECPPKDPETNEKSILLKGEDKEQIEPQAIKFDATFGTWGLKHPRRPELRYMYPPPTPSILTNILHALAAVPKFYVQVLHLMNKMDIPAPFGTITPVPPIRSDIREPTLPDDTDQLEMDISSDTESELESGEDDEGRKRVKEVQARKRLPKGLKRQRTKRPRLSDLQDSGTSIPSSAAALPVSQVFEMLNDVHAGSKKIELKLPSTIAHVPDSQLAARQNQMPNAFSLPLPSISQHNLAPAGGFTQQVQPLQQQTAPVVEFSQQMQTSQQHTAPVTHSYHTSALQSSYLQAEPHRLPLLPTSHQEPSSSALDSTNLEVQTKPNEQEREPEVSGAGGFGILQPVQKEEKNETEEDSATKEWSKSKFISSSELRRSRLSHSEMKELSIFRGYNVGEPSCRLYIKNLAKSVTEEDIHWVYGKYVDWDKGLATNIFDITLMKEGRMKGQAFVTLLTEEDAIAAVKDTNGFVLKDKPLVVQFARSAKVKK